VTSPTAANVKNPYLEKNDFPVPDCAGLGIKIN